MRAIRYEKEHAVGLHGFMCEWSSLRSHTLIMCSRCREDADVTKEEAREMEDEDFRVSIQALSGGSSSLLGFRGAECDCEKEKAGPV